MNPPNLTLKEVANYLRVHPATIRKLIRRRDLPLPCFKRGSDYRFNLEAVLRWMADGQEQEMPSRELATEQTEIARARVKRAWGKPR